MCIAGYFLNVSFKILFWKLTLFLRLLSWLQDDSVSVTNSSIADDSSRSETPTLTGGRKKLGKGKYNRCRLQYKCTDYLKVLVHAYVTTQAYYQIEEGVIKTFSMESGGFYLIVKVLIVLCFNILYIFFFLVLGTFFLINTVL